MSFYLFTKSFSISGGLLPPDPQLEKFLDRFTLEKGIVFGTILLLAGGALLTAALWQWARHDFGPLSYPQSLRIVIPSITLIILGVQAVFSSFFISILRLGRK